jgi:hypothetical protein
MVYKRNPNQTVLTTEEIQDRMNNGFEITEDWLNNRAERKQQEEDEKKSLKGNRYI